MNYMRSKTKSIFRLCVGAILIFTSVGISGVIAEEKPSEGEKFLELIQKEGIGNRFVLSINATQLLAEEEKIGMPHQNMTPDWRIKLQASGSNGEYEVDGSVPVGFNPSTGTIQMGLPLGRGTLFKVSGKIKWFGQWLEPKKDNNPLFLVLGEKNGNIEIVHVSGDLVQIPKTNSNRKAK